MAQKSKKQQDSWFKRQSKKYNTTEFLPLMHPSALDRGIINVFRDIANFNISIEEDGGYFLNRSFIERCISVAYSKWFFHDTNARSVQAMNTNQDQTVFSVYETDKAAADAYAILVTYLSAIRDTGDLNNLMLAGQFLQGYRFNI